jgi:hypothetical protein
MPNDRRKTPRFRVQFRTTFFGPTKLEGDGTVLDLSLGGCRVEASTTVHPSLLLELRIYVPELDWPIMIDGATVQWVNGQTFGLSFLQLREAEQARLRQLIERLADVEED